MKAQLRSFITYYVECPKCEHEIVLGDEYPRRELVDCNECHADVEIDFEDGLPGVDNDCVCCQTEGEFVQDQDGACARCEHAKEMHYEFQD
jgi:hypothetical protein